MQADLGERLSVLLPHVRPNNLHMKTHGTYVPGISSARAYLVATLEALQDKAI